MADSAFPEPRSVEPELPGATRRIWVAAAASFLLGMGAAGWLGWANGADFGRIVGWSQSGDPGSHPEQQPGGTPAPALTRTAMPDGIALAGRVAALEQRLDRVDARVEAASGNAARAEALLVAFAVRRVVERGAPLGYLADQLKLRFGDAQPNAVATIIAGAKDPVPMAQLAARLEALAPQLADAGQPALWRRVTRELADLFVVRRDRPALSDANARFADARRALGDGRIDEAVADVQHLSTAADAASWNAAALRYRDIQRALDLIDTTALLEPHQLHDGGGNPVNPVLR